MSLLDFLKTFARRLGKPRSAGLLAPGMQAPAFDLEDQRGMRQRLSDYRGRRVVLWFYPKADTPG
jgi:peroxiredoxin Q/BCP